MNNLIIGIAGGSGSGKTTLALRLKERFGEDEVRLISHDSYYKRHSAKLARLATASIDTRFSFVW